MKTVSPDYYDSFKCIAERCRHTCCAGWEIDIDERSLNKYKNYSGPLSERFLAYIEPDDEGAHFKLIENEERCPFLNKSGLCDIISELDETWLCDICTDHPRFRNYFDDRTEIGLGLCCEEAARLILDGNDEPLLNLEPEQNDPFAEVRRNAFSIIFDRTLTWAQRCDNICKLFGAELPRRTVSETACLYDGLEYMSPQWHEMLEALKRNSDIVNNLYIPNTSERLLHYFIYRHLANGVYENDFDLRIIFSVMSTQMIVAMSKTGEDIHECARIYSSEIEYSDENIDILLDRVL